MGSNQVSLTMQIDNLLAANNTPDPSTQPDNYFLKTSSGVATWSDFETAVQAVGLGVTGLPLASAVNQVLASTGTGAGDHAWTNFYSILLDDGNAGNSLQTTWSRSKILSELNNKISTSENNRLLPNTAGTGQVPTWNGSEWAAADLPTTSTITTGNVLIDGYVAVEGGTPPSGGEQRFQFTQIGKLVMFTFAAWYATAGVNNDFLDIKTGGATGIPEPATPTGLGTDNRWSAGSALRTNSANGHSGDTAYFQVTTDTTNPIRLRDAFVASNVKGYHINGVYITA